MNFDLNSLFPDLEALTPEGRWNALQSWLKENPKYGERAERWSTQTVDQVFNDIRILALDEYGALAVFAIDSAAIKPKIMRAIEVLQACYRERAACNNQQLEKETKNVRTTRTAGKRSKKNHRRSNAGDRD